METTTQAVRLALAQAWVWLLAMLIFFFNTLPFPGGLTITLMLTPVWFYLLMQWQAISKKHVLVTAAFFGVYAAIHFLNGINISYYLVSSALFVSNILFVAVFYRVISNPDTELDGIFRQLLMLNFVFTLISLPVLFTPIRETVWYVISISQGIEPIPRLKMFTSEASHYSFFFAPLFIYFCARFMFFRVRRPWLTLGMISVPLVLSFSLGVLACLAITGAIMLVLFHRQIFPVANRKKILLWCLLFCLLLVALLVLFPDNPLSQRILNVFEGKDTSARGRTYESFILAHKIIAQKNFLFGAGPGQMKEFGRQIVIQYYYYTVMPEVVRIPNSAAETIVCFGYVGFALRMLALGFLFIKTKVARNPFRLWLFLFLFVFQFTGSYITHTAEYILWAFAFAPVFPDFILRPQHKSSAAL